MFKNYSQQWLAAGTVGPFATERAVPNDEVFVVRCRAKDVLNLQGTTLVRFEPPEVRFVTHNATESVRMKIWVHASFPQELKLPETLCSVSNHSLAQIEPPPPKTPMAPPAARSEDDPDWLLVSHFVPPLPKGQQSPKKGLLYAWKCHASVPLTRVVPEAMVLDETNYTNPSYLMALHVHDTYPDDVAIPQPDCHLSVLDSRTGKAPTRKHASSATSRGRSTSPTNPQHSTWWMNWLALLVMIVSTIYLFYKPQWQKSKGKDKGRAAAAAPHNKPSKKNNHKKQNKKNNARQHGKAISPSSANQHKKKKKKNSKKSATASGAANISLKLSDYLVEEDMESDAEEGPIQEKQVHETLSFSTSSSSQDNDSESTLDGWTVVQEGRADGSSSPNNEEDPKETEHPNEDACIGDTSSDPSDSENSPSSAPTATVVQEKKQQQQRKQGTRDDAMGMDQTTTGKEETQGRASSKADPPLTTANNDKSTVNHDEGPVRSDDETKTNTTGSLGPGLNSSSLEEATGNSTSSDRADPPTAIGSLEGTVSPLGPRAGAEPTADSSDGGKMDPPGTLHPRNSNHQTITSTSHPPDAEQEETLCSTCPADDEHQEVDRLLAECAQPTPLSSTKETLYEFVLYVDGMTCQGCETVVRNTLAKLPDTHSVVVSWRDASATIQSLAPRLDLLAVAQAMDDVGFGVFMGPATQAPQEAPHSQQVQLEPSDVPTAVVATNPSSPLRAPPGFPSPHRESSLSLMDELIGTSTIRRYRCRCGESECICSAHPVHSGDPGREISLGDLCDRLERNLNLGLFGAVSKEQQSERSLRDWIQSSGGGDEPFREQLASMPIPCACGDLEAPHGDDHDSKA